MFSTPLMLIPFPRNPAFVGRDATLLTLDEQLQRHRFVTIHAPSGVGKTAIALEYAYRFSSHYPCLFWLNASTRESLLADYHELSRRLGLPLQAEQKSAEENQGAAVSEQEQPQVEPRKPGEQQGDPDKQDQQPPLILPDWLAVVRQYLLILDDLQDPALLQEIFPASLAGHILVTTRVRDLAFPQPTTSLELARLDAQSSAQLLLRLASPTTPTRAQDQTMLASDPAFSELARELSGQPLGLALAGTYIKASGVTFTRLHQDYLTSLKQVPIFQERLDSFSRELVALTSLIVASLRQSNPYACEILEICAFLAPIAIPTLLFKSTSVSTATSTGTEQQQVDPVHPASVEQPVAALDCLFTYGLLAPSLSKQIFSIHPLFQLTLQSMLPLEQQRRSVVQALHLLFQLSPGVKSDSAWCLRILAHIHHCAILSEPWTFTSAEIARTFAWAAAALEQYDVLDAALFLRRKALAIWEGIPGTKPAALIALRQKQFLLIQRLGNLSEAEALLHQIITSCTFFYGADHPITILHLMRLARVYLDRSSNEEAEACYKKALALSRRGRAQFDQLVIAIQYELAMFYVRTSDFSSAEFLLQGVYTAFEQQLGADHAETLKRALELAVVCMMTHNWSEAETLIQKVRSSYENDPAIPLAETLRVWHYLALILVAQANWDAATAIYQRILDRVVETRGRLHPDLLPYLTECVSLYQAQQDKQTEKKAVLAWSQEIREELLAHPQETSPRALLDNFNALGSLYFGQGRFVEAERLFLRSLLLSDHVQLKDSLTLAINLSALALTQIAQGQARVQQATLFIQASLTAWQHVLGPNSPELVALRTQYEQWMQENTRQQQI